MTEEEWRAATDPEKMLLAIRDVVSERKMRLFAIACCRRIWGRITDPRCRAAVEFAERFVDVGLERRRGRPAIVQSAREASRAADAAGFRCQDQPEYPTRMAAANACSAGRATLEYDGWFGAHIASGIAANAVAWEVIGERSTGPFVWEPTAKEVERRRQLPLLHDVFADPFHPPAPVAAEVLAWNGGTVPKLAAAIYDEGAFDRLPVLADALEEAGCDDALVAHCRGGPHVRGCWAVDLILGKP